MTEQKRPRQQVTEQNRAAQAWDNIQKVPNAEQKKYGTLARRLPALIQSNGLGQALAFLKAKGGGKEERDAHNIIFNHVSDWVKDWMKADSNEDLLVWIIKQRSDRYRRATTEAIAYTVWLRRFAEAQGWGDAEGET